MSELRKHVADGACKKKRNKKPRHEIQSDCDDFVDMTSHVKRKKDHSPIREESVGVQGYVST